LSRADITLNPGRKLILPEKLLPLATGCLVIFEVTFFKIIFTQSLDS
jgi:hypothetical protein